MNRFSDLIERDDVLAPKRYWELLDSGFLREYVNGCGPQGWKVDVVPDCVYGLYIGDLCDVHDVMYIIGRTAADKELADEVLLLNSRKRVDKQSANWFMRLIRRHRILKYFDAVFEAGTKSFNSDL